MVHPHTKGGFVCLKPCYHHHLALESRVFKAEFLGVFSPVWIHCPTLLTALQFLTLRDFFFLSILLFPYLFFEVSIPIWRSSLPWLPLLYWNYDSYSWGGAGRDRISSSPVCLWTPYVAEADFEHLIPLFTFQVLGLLLSCSTKLGGSTKGKGHAW